MTDRTHSESWLPVRGFEGRYEVSDLGRVRSLLTDRVLKATFSRYATVSLRRDGRTLTCNVHTLVARAFIGECPPGQLVRHRDDDRRNNAARNLVHGTQSDNMFDAVANGVHPTASQTMCKRGHPFTDENTYHGTYTATDGAKRPRRQCRTCTNAHQRAYSIRKAAA
ncbi:hypothetical protein GCM10009775_04710 [Microbacterium aoyamense]|uniref:HNH endonuclease n=1 Tax=Microbacterium aoyamense TaxID=344166 RepID=A0ABP5AIU4_9MICO|nr:NUMOD4 motif-containing HNH endonuclease [Microbacterium aoyamense]